MLALAWAGESFGTRRQALYLARLTRHWQSSKMSFVIDSWKTWLWRSLLAAAIVIVIAACFYAEENARGVRVWEKCESEITARGESLKWDDYIPAPVPDAENFYQAPMMTEWFVRATNNTAYASLYKLLDNPENSTNSITELSASNYLAWGVSIEPELQRIRDALKRPSARMDLDYTLP